MSRRQSSSCWASPRIAEKHPLAASRPDLVQDLDRRLKLWRQEQLAYYADIPRQSREYAPVVKD
jgi:hypothetical protein